MLKMMNGAPGEHDHHAHHDAAQARGADD
jgi:hypothetical protein